MRQLLASEHLAGSDPTQPASRMSIANAIRDYGAVAKQHAKGDRGAQEMQGCEETQTEALLRLVSPDIPASFAHPYPLWHVASQPHRWDAPLKYSCTCPGSTPSWIHDPLHNMSLESSATK